VAAEPKPVKIFASALRAAPRAVSPQLPWPVEMLPLHRLRPAKRNARTHSKKQVREIANSMARFGVINPIVADANGQIIAGHARVEAARLLGLAQVPVIRVSHLSDAEIRAYVLADNKLAAKAGWDREALAIELQDLQIVLPELGIDLDITGFEPAEVDSIMLDFAEGKKDPADQLPDIEDVEVSRKGELYVLGNHRLIVGDARNFESFKLLMQNDLAEMAFLDPPYNVRIEGHAGGHGRIKHREFACASGEMTSAQFIRFLQDTLGLCARHTAEGAISYICMDWRHMGELLEAGVAVYDELKNVCVWVKTNPGQGSFYRSQHELIFVYKKGKEPHINTFELGQHGRSRSNVWTYAGVNTFRTGRMDDLEAHPTVKPLGLVTDAMRDCSRRGSIVLDAFAGSGTTIVAAEQIGRRAFCMEIDPSYADVAIRRWQRISGRDAILHPTSLTFDEVAAGHNRDPSDQRRQLANRRRKGGT
jgi:DNA modification methylase